MRLAERHRCKQVTVKHNTIHSGNLNPFKIAGYSANVKKKPKTLVWVWNHSLQKLCLEHIAVRTTGLYKVTTNIYIHLIDHILWWGLILSVQTVSTYKSNKYIPDALPTLTRNDTRPTPQPQITLYGAPDIMPSTTVLTITPQPPTSYFQWWWNKNQKKYWLSGKQCFSVMVE